MRIEEPAQEVARSLGIELALGQPLAAADRERIVARMVRLIMRMIDRRPPDELMRRLLVTDPWPANLANKGIDALTFSGGVAEYLYKRETRRFGDLGFDLAHALATRWRTAATCRRSGTRARASARPSSAPRNSRSRSAATRSRSASPTSCRCRTCR